MRGNQKMEVMCEIVLFLILFDIVAGVVSAAKNHSLDSSVMRNGLFNKVGEILLLILGIFCNLILETYPFTQLGIPSEVTYAVAVYISGMEILSILENICKINPELPITKVLAIFNIEVDEDEPDKV